MIAEPSAAPSVSVLIPALNAAALLPQTLRSLQAQTRADWEAIVIDDGSTDGTVELARAVARTDPRVAVLNGGRREGPAAARKRGYAQARGRYVSFLDADDLLTPRAFELLAGLLDASPELGVVRGWWRRFDGHHGDMPRSVDSTKAELFDELAVYCVFANHAALTRRSVIDAAGGIETALRTCEDWDLWQRIARMGTRFGMVDEEVARYRWVPGSQSSDPVQMTRDALVVVERGHDADPRVADPDPRWAAGADRRDLASARLQAIVGMAAFALGAGKQPPREVLDAIDRQPMAVAELMAECLVGGMPLATGRDDRHWDEVWEIAAPALPGFLDELERRTGARRLAARTLRAVERIAVEAAAAHGVEVSIGRTRTVRADLTEPIVPVSDPLADRLTVELLWEGDELGTVELPVIDGAVSAEVIADAAAAVHFWEILGCWFEDTVYPALTVDDDGTVWRDGEPIGWTPSAAELHDHIGWTVFLQELWGLPAATEAELYQPEPDPDRPAGRGKPIEVELSATLPRRSGRRATAPLAVRLGGRGLGVIAPPGDSDAAVRAAVNTACGMELARTAVAVAVAGHPGSDERPLRARLAAAAQARRLRPPGATIGRPTAAVIGGAPNRLANLPAAAAGALLDAAAAAGEPVRRRYRASSGVAYDPGLATGPARPRVPARHAGADPAAERRLTFESLFAQAEDPWGYASAYERQKYDRTLEQVGTAGRCLELACAEGHFTRRLAQRCDELIATDISDVALERAKRRCAGLTNVEFRRLDMATGDLPDGPFDLIVCSEVLFYLADLDQVRAVAAGLAGALAPGGRLVTAHAHVLADDPGAPGFGWPGTPFGGKRIAAELAATDGLALVHRILCPLYRIDTYERLGSGAPPVAVVQRRDQHLPEGRAAAQMRLDHAPGRRVPAPEAPYTEPVKRLPILMYHQICHEPGPWTVSPAAFAAQLQYLAAVGYRSATLDEWSWAVESRNPLPGRRVVLTFDDGFANFAEHAWPLLREYGFGAMVFLVTDLVGGTNEWDAGLLPTAPLLDWDQVLALRDEGVEFGSHTATHADLALGSPAEAAIEMARARAALTRRLGAPPRTIAYPYGAIDEATAHLAGACGYEFGLTVAGGQAGFDSAYLELPRIEVAPADDLTRFAAKLGPGAAGLRGRA